MSYATSRKRPSDGVDKNRLYPEDRPIHEWYRFVLSYPPHVVRQYLDRFGISSGDSVLDPFCGTGTTLVECQKRGAEGIGLEANPVAHFAASTKLDWGIRPEALQTLAEAVSARVTQQLEADGIPDEPLFTDLSTSDEGLMGLSDEVNSLLLSNSISPRPLHKAIRLLRELDAASNSPGLSHLRLAFAKSIVHSSSNLRFGPEVGLGTIRPDAPVVAPWLSGVRAIAADLSALEAGPIEKLGRVLLADARDGVGLLAPESIDAVITSPPYPNEKDYTRTTRLESVLLGFVKSKSDMRILKEGLVSSNTRCVYKSDNDDEWVEDHVEIQRLSEEIEARRVELGKTSGFEKLYARVTRLYFGGMARHLAILRPSLRPGARLAYVVGDQASFFRIMIRTGTLLADIADRLGYEVESIDLFRTRAATATRAQLREEVVVLRWPGRKDV